MAEIGDIIFGIPGSDTSVGEMEQTERLMPERLPLPIQNFLRENKAELRRVHIQGVVVDDITFTAEGLQSMNIDSQRLIDVPMALAHPHETLQRGLLELIYPNAEVTSFGYDSVRDVFQRLANLQMMKPAFQFFSVLSHRPNASEAVNVWGIKFP